MSGDAATDREAYEGFTQRWQSIGFVPFKEKDAVGQAYKEALQEKFPAGSRGQRRGAKSPKSEKDRLVAKYNQLEQDIVNYENNIGFFAMSKNSEPLIKQMQNRIAQAKEELKALEAQIVAMDNEQEEQ